MAFGKTFKKKFYPVMPLLILTGLVSLIALLYFKGLVIPAGLLILLTEIYTFAFINRNMSIRIIKERFGIHNWIWSKIPEHIAVKMYRDQLKRIPQAFRYPADIIATAPGECVTETEPPLQRVRRAIEAVPTKQSTHHGTAGGMPDVKGLCHRAEVLPYPRSVRGRHTDSHYRLRCVKF